MPIATPEVYAEMLGRAKENSYAFPAINCTSSETVNAAIKGFADAGSDGIIQFSTGGAEFASGLGVKDMVTGDIDAVSQNTVDSTYSSISADGGFISYTNNNTGTESGAGAEGQIYVQHNPLPGDLTLKFGQPTLYEGTNDTITITLAIPAATDETIDLTVTPDTVPQQDIVGIPTSATIKAGQTKVTIPFKLEQDPLASTTSETFTVSATSSARTRHFVTCSRTSKRSRRPIRPS